MSFENELENYSPDKSNEKLERGIQNNQITPRVFLSLPFFQWKSFVIFLLASLIILSHWLTTSDLFQIPEDVAQSRQLFFKAKEGYFANKTYWDAKQLHFVEFIKSELLAGNNQMLLQRLQETPGEILISYFLNNIHQELDRLKRMTLFPKENASKQNSSCTLIITKQEPGIWPLEIMLSLELEVTVQAHRLVLGISRLRRGSQDLALGLSWAYFGPELESIRHIDPLSQDPFVSLLDH